jgi:hypothetical protein
MRRARISAERAIQLSGADQHIDCTLCCRPPHLGQQFLSEMIGRNQLGLPHAQNWRRRDGNRGLRLFHTDSEENRSGLLEQTGISLDITARPKALPVTESVALPPNQGEARCQSFKRLSETRELRVEHAPSAKH